MWDGDNDIWRNLNVSPVHTPRRSFLCRPRPGTNEGYCQTFYLNNVAPVQNDKTSATPDRSAVPTSTKPTPPPPLTAPLTKPVPMDCQASKGTTGRLGNDRK